MEARQVPWWRKALDFALNGIRSGLGLFSRAQKDHAEIEPETAAEREEIREEEKELTDHSPEKESIDDLAEVSEAVAAPNADRDTAAVGTSAASEIAGQSEPETEAEFDEQAIPEPEAVIEETAPAPATRPEKEIEIAPETSAAAVEAPEAPEPAPEPEPEPPVHAVEAVEQVAIDTVQEEENQSEEAADSEPLASDELATVEAAQAQTADEADEPPMAEPVVVAEPVAEPEAEQAVTQPTPVAVAAAEDDLVSAAEPALEVESEPQEAQEIIEPTEEVEAAELEAPVEIPADAEDSVITEEAPETEAMAEAEAAEEPVEYAAEDEAELAVLGPLAEMEDPSVDEETADAEEARAPEMSPEAEVTEEPVADEDPTEDAVPLAAEPEPEAKPQIKSAPPAIDAFHEQVTEPQEKVENDSIDEVAPQAESAISEELMPESASPVPDEMIEQVVQAADKKIEEPVAEAPDQINELTGEQTPEQTVGQTTEQAAVPVSEQSEQSIADESQQAQEIDQALEQPMELNHPNPEPSADTEVTAEAAAPDLTAEPETATEASAEAPFAASDAQPSTESSDDAEAPSIEPVAAHPSKPFIKLEAREGDANASPFSIIVSQVYDGPLDLLLDLIRKQDIDIYDIPIARITAQFLAYVDQLKASDVDVAGEFIYTASLLIHIKSKMLLPRAPSGPEEAAEDPRRELVERLLEHERFKNAAQMLQQKQMLEAATWTNPGVRDFKEDAGAEPEIAADTVDLVRVFREILDRARNRPVLNVEEDSVTVGQMIQFLSRRLTMEDKPVALRKLLSHTRSERALIAMFLALLELVRLQAILLRQDRAFSEIFVKKHTDFETVMNQGLARDDWQ